MAKEKNSFVLYYDLEDILLDLSDSQIAELFRAIFAYEKRGEAYSGSDPEVKIAMRFVSRALDDNDERYRAKVEKRREAGRKGGLKSAQSRKQKKQNEANQANATKGKQKKQSQANQANATKGKQKKQSQANQADNEPEPVPDNDTDSEGTTSPSCARVTQQSTLASQKVQWADNVTMTNAEHQKLLDAHGPADTALMIEHLSHYKAANGKHYDSDYRAILAWVTKWLSEQKGTKTGAAQRPSKAPTPMPPTQESLAEQEQRILANERWMRDFLESQREDEQNE